MANVFSVVTSSTAEVLAFLKSTADGLTSSEAAARLVKHGPNTVSQPRPAWGRILLRQVRSFFVLLLLAAGILNLVIGDVLDGYIIFGFVLVFVGLGFFQEFRAETAVWNLRTFLTRYAHVKRNGHVIRLATDALVPGDVILVRPGDVLPADVRFLETHNLQIDESVLTGESVPVVKHANAMKETDPLRAGNLAFFGSSVTEGHGEAVIVATGSSISFAKMFADVSRIERPSRFEGQIRRVARLLTVLTVCLAVAAYGVHAWMVGGWPSEPLIFLVALVVAVVPEALALVVALAFAKGSVVLAKQHVVVKRLTALEDLGGMSVLCTDKTGTITQNKMTLKEVYPVETAASLQSFALAGALAGRRHGYNPFDAATIEAATAQEHAHTKPLHVHAVFPFDPVHRLGAAVVEREGKWWMIYRGAPEAILAASTGFTEASARAPWMKRFQARGRKGERVLAVAHMAVSAVPKDPFAQMDSWTFDGFLSFEDPLKVTSKPAAVLLRELGVKLKIITGDAVEVAATVGRELELLSDGDDVMTGEAFEKLSTAGRRKAARAHHVFARTLPAHKLMIVEALRADGTVGFLGEGFNDIPALRRADLSLVVDKAPDLSRDAADIVLLQDDLFVIARGVEEGRIIFANTLKYVRTTLAANVGNFISLTIASFALPFLPLLPIQILLVNLLSDFPMIAISMDRVPAFELRRPQTYRLGHLFIFILSFGVLSSFFDLAFFLWSADRGAGALQTGWFLYSILTEIVAFLSLRSLVIFFRAGLPGRGIMGVSVLAVLIGFGLISWPVTAGVFHFIPLSIEHISFMTALLAVYFIANEFLKALFRRFRTM